MEITIEVLFKVFFLAIVADFIVAIIAEAKNGKLKSRKCSNGMFRSLGECIVLIIFIGLDYLIPSLNPYLSTFIIGFIFKEGLSIVESLVKLDVWIPESIKKTLEVGADKVDNIS